MDKELFVEIINYCIGRDETEFELTDLLKKYGGDMSDFMGFSTDTTGRILGWLERIMHEKPDPVYGTNISWWYYDCDCGKDAKVKVNGKWKNLKTPEELYDYIKETNDSK